MSDKPDDLDTLPEEPKPIVCGECGFTPFVRFSEYQELRAQLQRNIEARKAEERDRKAAKTRMWELGKAVDFWQERAEEFEARARELEKRISGYEQEADRMTILNVELMNQLRALQPEQPDERKES